MIFWSLSALIWFKNMKKMLLQMTSGFLQLESTLFFFASQMYSEYEKLEKHTKYRNASDLI
jgi:hypothetical protein